MKYNVFDPDVPEWIKILTQWVQFMDDQSFISNDTVALLMQNVASHDGVFAKLIEALPNPVQVFSPDGTLIMVNSAFVEEVHITDPSGLIGRYNILQEPTAEEYGALRNIKDAFTGKPSSAVDFMVPVHEIKRRFDIPTEDAGSYYMDVFTIPLLDENENIICVVNIFNTKRKPIERTEIDRAKSYIEAHWQSEFHVREVAEAVFLSSSYFSRMFKRHTGKTPHEYYMSIKIERMKEMLLDRNLSIEEAFAACGIRYHSHYVRWFKKETGFTPKEFRKRAYKKTSERL